MNGIKKILLDESNEQHGNILSQLYDLLQEMRRLSLVRFGRDPQHQRPLDAAYLDNLLNTQDADGLWRFVYDEHLPFEAKVDYWYWPTYMATAALMHEALARSQKNQSMNKPLAEELPEPMLSALRKGLDVICGVRLNGHGYDAEFERIDALNFYLAAGLVPFLERFPDCSPAFTEMIRDIIAKQWQHLQKGETFGDWNVNFADAWLAIQKHFRPIDRLFVYGSLMSGRSACRLLTEQGCVPEGTAMLEGYHLYDLGSYPAILPAKKYAKDEQETRVKAAAAKAAAAGAPAVEPVALVSGELFRITAEALPRLDEYEGEGHLYRRQPVMIMMNGERQIAWTYIFLQNIEPGRLVPLGRQPWRPGCLEERTVIDAGSQRSVGSESNPGFSAESKLGDASEQLSQKLVWYATYGSNCLFERFRCYIEGGRFDKLPSANSGCRDKTLPLADRPYELPHDIYFANKSPNWDSSVCFLDHTKPGHAYGRIFLITSDQFQEIHRQEGSGAKWYGHTLTLGEVDGVPVRTFTNANRLRGEAPQKNYLDVVREGLTETWGDRLSAARIRRYLEERIQGL